LPVQGPIVNDAAFELLLLGVAHSVNTGAADNECANHVGGRTERPQRSVFLNVV